MVSPTLTDPPPRHLQPVENVGFRFFSTVPDRVSPLASCSQGLERFHRARNREPTFSAAMMSSMAVVFAGHWLDVSTRLRPQPVTPCK